MYRIAPGFFLVSLTKFLNFAFDLDQFGLFYPQGDQGTPHFVGSRVAAGAGHLDIDHRPGQDTQVHHPPPVCSA
jgi:hypothetical protein